MRKYCEHTEITQCKKPTEKYNAAFKEKITRHEPNQL